MDDLEGRIAFVDVFDQRWGSRWRPAQWAGVVDSLYGSLSAEDLGRMATEAASWPSFLSASGAKREEWSPSDGPHDEWGDPIEASRETSSRSRPSSLLAETYIELLTGRTPERNGFIRCPFHKGGEERTASLSLNGPYWRCFGCATGGTVIDFAAQLWGLDTKGADFLEVKHRLRELGIDA